jgi:hypothetical protein
LKGLEQREGCLSADGADFHHREHREHRGGKRALLTTTVAKVAKEAGGSGGASVLTSRVGVPSFKIQPVGRFELETKNFKLRGGSTESRPTLLYRAWLPLLLKRLGVLCALCGEGPGRWDYWR